MRRFVLLACFVLPTAAMAEIAQKPGLWEVALELHTGSEVPEFPPEVLERMSELGVEVPFGKPIFHQVCLTPDQVKKNAVPNFNDPDSGCKLKNGKRVGDKFTADMVCDGQYSGQGTVQLALLSPEAYEGHAAFKGVGADGFNVDMTSDFKGKWLDARCGDVAPIR